MIEVFQDVTQTSLGGRRQGGHSNNHTNEIMAALLSLGMWGILCHTAVFLGTDGGCFAVLYLGNKIINNITDYVLDFL